MSVVIEQLRISDSGTRMHLDFHVNKACIFKDIFLDSVTIMTADKVPETYPDVPTEDFIFKADFCECSKCCHMALDIGSFMEATLNWNPVEKEAKCGSKPYAAISFDKQDFSHDLFFVYIRIKGTPDKCTPCRLDEEITLGVTFDEHLLYQRVMDFTKAFADKCTVPVGFTDFILLWNAFKAAVETEHYIPAIKYYNMLFGNYDEKLSRDGSHSPFGGMGYGNQRPVKTRPCHG